MIKLDYAAMAASAVAIKAMAQTSVTITDPLAQSMGNATEKEREVMALLLRLGQQELPALVNASAELINTVSREFRRAETAASKSFEG